MAHKVGDKVVLRSHRLGDVVHSGDVGIVSHVYTEENVLDRYEVEFETRDQGTREEFFVYDTMVKAAN